MPFLLVTLILESLITLKHFIHISWENFNSKLKASYSTMLLVQSNPILNEKASIVPLEEVKKIRAPTPVPD